MFRRMIDSILVHLFCAQAVQVYLEADGGGVHPDCLSPVQARLLHPMTRLGLLERGTNYRTERQEWFHPHVPHLNEELWHRLFDSEHQVSKLVFGARDALLLVVRS